MLVIGLGAVSYIQAAWRLSCISRDGVFFVEFARQIKADGVAAFGTQTKQPGYSILLLGLHSLIGRFVSSNGPAAWEICGQVLAVMGGIAAVWLIYFLTRRLFDSTTALVAALLAAFWPQLVTLSSDVLSDSLHLALYLAGLLLGLRAMKEKQQAGMAHAAKWGTLAACGAVCGVAYWLRQEALGAVAAMAICLLWPTNSVGARRRIGRAAIVAAAFIAIVAPYSIMVGKVMPNKSIKDLLRGHRDERTAEKSQSVKTSRNQHEERVAGPQDQQAGPVVWWDAPVKMLDGWGKSGRYVLSTLALVGFFWGRVPRSEPSAKRLVVLAALLQIIAAQARGMQFGIISDRYLLIPAGLSIPWSAAGLLAITRALAARFGRSMDRILPIAALIGVVPMAIYDLMPTSKGTRWEREAGAWIADHATKGDVVVAAHQRSPVAFYAGLERRWPIDERTIRVIREGAAWVVDDPGMSRITKEERALLAKCREHLCAAADSQSWSAEDGRRVAVYRIVP